jgi:predicted RND superfamily exporter protein
MRLFKEVNMSLTKDSHGKQVAGIILVVVFLLALFAYGIRGYRNSTNCYCFFGPNKKVSMEVETCKAENGQCPLETQAVR